MLLFEQFQHPNGQIPAYEWEFSDLNPPVHAWASGASTTWTACAPATADREFLERCFHKLLINFAWWVNKVDSEGNNIFEGGFLGLDNITVVDRSEPLPDGAMLEQSDATGWMGMFCLNLMRIALELAKENRVYEGLATKFFQHYVYVGGAMKNMGGRDYQLWDEDGRLLLRRAALSRRHVPQVPRALAGRPDPAVRRRASRRRRGSSRLPDVPRRTCTGSCGTGRDLVGEACSTQDGTADASARPDDRRSSTSCERLLQRLWDPDEFLSPYGIRSLSKYHEAQPFRFGGSEVRYEPAEADVKIKGGNSNWRGPIWFPTSFLLIESLRKLDAAHDGSRSRSTTPGSPGTPLTPRDMAQRDRQPHDPHLHPRRRRPAAGLRRDARSSRTIRTGATACSSTSTSTATTAPAWAPATRPAGRAWWPT